MWILLAAHMNRHEPPAGTPHFLLRRRWNELVSRDEERQRLADIVGLVIRSTA
jgi:hypothetical protein